MLFELMAVGSTWFWIVVGISAIALIITLTEEGLVWSTTVVIGALAIVGLFTGTSLFAMIYQNLIWFGVILLAYIALGAIWSIIKWYLYLQYVKTELREAKDNFLLDNDIAYGEIPDNLFDDWKRIAARIIENENGFVGNLDKRSIQTPSVSPYKWHIIRWMTFCPLSVLWSILDDFIVALYERIYYGIKRILQEMSRRVFDEDLQELNK